MNKIDSEKIRLYLEHFMIPDMVQTDPMKRKSGQVGHINRTIAIIEGILEDERIKNRKKIRDNLVKIYGFEGGERAISTYEGQCCSIDYFLDLILKE